MASTDEIREALRGIGEGDRPQTAYDALRDSYDDILALVDRGFSRLQIYELLNGRVDLGISKRTFSTYLARIARERGE